MPNAFTLAALLAWPLVTIVLFRVLSVPKAAASSIIAGYLLLPKRGGFDLPLLPPYDHELAVVLPALVMASVMSRTSPVRGTAPAPEASRVLDGWLPRTVLAKTCVLVLLAAPIVTSMLNGRPLFFGPTVLPGLGIYDAASAILATAVMLLPFLIGRKYLAHAQEHVVLLLLLCLAGLAYSFLALYEVRMSPQLNRMIYGWAPDWMMTMRRGGWRPSVFLGMSLRVGIFFTVCILATIGLTRLRPAREGWMYLLAALWLLMTLFFVKTLGAFLIAVALAPVVLLCGVRLQLLAAAGLAAIVLLYPTMRNADLFPIDRLLATLSYVANEDRMGSLDFRIHHEDLLLERAQERPLFGWGRWGRSRIYNENGDDVSITDGTWVIVFGQFGWAGYLGQFGLLTIPVVLLALRRRRYEVTKATSILAVMLAANLVDLIPNSGLTPITWLMVGALVGRMEVKPVAAPVPETEPADHPRGPVYRRSFPVPAHRDGHRHRRPQIGQAYRHDASERGGR